MSFLIIDMTIDAGSKVIANVTALLILAGLTKVADIKSLDKEVAAKSPPGTEKKKAALMRGYKSVDTI